MHQILSKILKKLQICQLNRLSIIINLLLKLSIFPERCKIVQLKPLFKKGSKSDPKNHRPISLPPLVSKITEKSTHNQLQSYLKENVLLYKYQSSFRANSSADSCLAQLTDFALTDKGVHTGLILIELQKEFGTLDHKVFLEKMTCLCFKISLSKWFES